MAAQITQTYNTWLFIPGATPNKLCMQRKSATNITFSSPSWKLVTTSLQRFSCGFVMIGPNPFSSLFSTRDNPEHIKKLCINEIVPELQELLQIWLQQSISEKKTAILWYATQPLEKPRTPDYGQPLLAGVIRYVMFPFVSEIQVWRILTMKLKSKMIKMIGSVAEDIENQFTA